MHGNFTVFPRILLPTRLLLVQLLELILFFFAFLDYPDHHHIEVAKSWTTKKKMVDFPCPSFLFHS